MQEKHPQGLCCAVTSPVDSPYLRWPGYEVDMYMYMKRPPQEQVSGGEKLLKKDEGERKKWAAACNISSSISPDDWAYMRLPCVTTPVKQADLY